MNTIKFAAMFLKAKQLFICLLLLLGTALSSCETDLDANAPYKETAVVYGLLDFNQPRQYVRVQKTFQNGTGNAYDYAKITDSLYFKNITVKLINRSNGSSITLQKDNSIPMKPGVFASDSNFLYYTDQPLDKWATYELEITNNETNTTFGGTTTLVDSVNWRNPSRTLQIPFEVKSNQYYSVSWETARNAYMYDLVIRMYYTDYLTNNSGQVIDSVQRVLDWPAIKGQKTDNALGGDRKSFSISQINLFSFLAANIPVTNNVKRRAYKVDFMIYGASQDLASYILINAPSFGVVQKSTQYTNIRNGLGIFSSRNQSSIKGVPVSTQMWLEMANSPTLKNLKFF